MKAIPYLVIVLMLLILGLSECQRPKEIVLSPLPTQVQADSLDAARWARN
ncbi:MAG: hypothetical protein AAGI38_24385 [Bacteroidota bacterium]